MRTSQSWIYASGKPYTEPVGLESLELFSGRTVDRVIVGAKNGGRPPAYHRLEVALNRAFYIGDTLRGAFSLALFNVYDRRNTWYKEFDVVEDEIIESDIQLMGRTLNAAVTIKF